MTKEEFAIKWFDKKLDPNPAFPDSVFWPNAAQRELDYNEMIKTEIKAFLIRNVTFDYPEKWNDNFFTGNEPGGVLKTEHVLTEEQHNELAKVWAERNRKAVNED